ncbi:MAG: Glycosyltransferase involved in cell wall bisynthesis [Candidatus Electronema aureum]|uniref:Glycosyltransferase involved in cell wall bisynthesis n=1 Tax=Candidatus Electronema aureum TaxID=2005002 RepID=A0A521FZV7_9BACT|nr:MAG: Glycosyltransferase involved in cell wall bisynthesis [Candidatus Electronema aureum]
MKIFVFTSCYLPGFKAGGPIRTIVNMVDRLGNELEFFIMTRDRDLNSEVPYSDIKINEWNYVGKARVFYASPDIFSVQGIAALLRQTPYDVLYLNSFFCPHSTGIPVLLKWLGCIPKTPVIIAPRGEFSAGALAIKGFKKQNYIAVVKALGLYKDFIWQASSLLETEDIRKNIGEISMVHVAQDLLSLQQHIDTSSHIEIRRKSGKLRLVFLSRISPIKNLDYLLDVLTKVSVPVQLSIYGPLEDIDYWAQCTSIISRLPPHVSITYCGELIPQDVSAAFSAHDLFVFPTQGENFGHVIFEALNAGTAVVVSNQTPWSPDPDGAVEVLPLADVQVWVDAIERWAGFSVDEFTKHREAAHRYAWLHLNDTSILESNRQLFKTACNYLI